MTTNTNEEVVAVEATVTEENTVKITPEMLTLMDIERREQEIAAKEVAVKIAA